MQTTPGVTAQRPYALGWNVHSWQWQHVAWRHHHARGAPATPDVKGRISHEVPHPQIRRILISMLELENSTPKSHSETVLARPPVTGCATPCAWAEEQLGLHDDKFDL